MSLSGVPAVVLWKRRGAVETAAPCGATSGVVWNTQVRSDMCSAMCANRLLQITAVAFLTVFLQCGISFYVSAVCTQCTQRNNLLFLKQEMHFCYKRIKGNHIRRFIFAIVVSFCYICLTYY
jgi:hypothetical protein